MFSQLFEFIRHASQRGSLWRRFGMAAVVLCICGWGLWHLKTWPVFVSPQQVGSSQATVRGQAGVPASAQAAITAAVAEAAGSGGAQEAKLVTAADAGPKPNEAPRVWDLCGMGRMPVPMDAAASQTPTHLLRPGAAAAQQAMLDRLEAAGPRQRAVAAHLRDALPDAPAPSRPLGVRWMELARMAPNDAVLHAWALSACGGGAACASAPVAHAWLRLEPSNGAAYLAWATTVPSQAEQALSTMASADHWETHTRQFLAEAMAVLPPDAPGYVQVELMRWIMTAWQQLGLLPMGLLTQRCKQPAQVGPGSGPWCEKVADLLSESSGSLVERRLGEVIQERAGVRDPGDSEHRALMDANLDAWRPPAQAWSCQARTELKNKMTALARSGEVGFALKWMSTREVGSGEEMR